MSKPPIMKVDRRGFLVASSAALVLGKTDLVSGETEQPSEGAEFSAAERNVEGKEVAVYSTADKTDQRLSPTGKLTFKHMGQPLETQVCVFVDPSKKFQTILGIG